eukprot:487390_1
MSHTQTNQFKQKNVNFEQIISNHSTVLDAINALKQELSFMNEETLYNFVIYLLKQNQHLSLIDNFTNDLNDNDLINKETENIISSIEDNELIPLRKILISDDETKINDTIVLSLSFKMDWMKICECISHEMWPKLSFIIKSIIEQKHININNMNDDNIEIIIDSLKNRDIDPEPIQYLQKLMQRAIKFAPTNENNNISKYNAFHTDTGIRTILRDVFSAHKLFVFVNFNFAEYNIKQFESDIVKNGTQILGEKK